MSNQQLPNEPCGHCGHPTSCTDYDPDLPPVDSSCERRSSEPAAPALLAELRAERAECRRQRAVIAELRAAFYEIEDLPVDDYGFRSIPPGGLDAARAALSGQEGE